MWFVFGSVEVQLCGSWWFSGGSLMWFSCGSDLGHSCMVMVAHVVVA